MKNHSIFITNLRFWLILVLETALFGYLAIHPCLSQVVEPEVPVRNPGQMPLPPGLEYPLQKIKNQIGGIYSDNVTLFFRNSPYRVVSDLIVEEGATIKIETGVQMYFDSGVGLDVRGSIHAIGNEFAHIQMLPFQQQATYDGSFPEFKLIDGPTVRQGRLQIKFRDRWRSVCTQLTNWTSIDTGVACRSMGYSDGAFYQWFLRNNDTYPFAMPRPSCLPTASNLWQCEGFARPEDIPMSENLCQGEDDIGLYCWGQPIFKGWAKHWRGMRIFNSPYHFVYDDPNEVSVIRESDSRLEFIDIMYAGYDGKTKNATEALYIQGVPPIMNGLKVHRSARDGIYFYEPSGPILIANSTVSFNRGHGIAVDNTTDGRVFINMTVVEHNYGDGIWYRQRAGGLNLVKSFRQQKSDNYGDQQRPVRVKRWNNYYEEEKPRIEMCREHLLPRNYFFPHLVKLTLHNGTVVDPLMPPICWMVADLPRFLPYTYTLQFLGITNLNPASLGSKTSLLVCDGNSTLNDCVLQRYRIPIKDGVFPQSVSLRSSGNPIYIALDHDLGPLSNGRVFGDVDLSFKIHASVTDKAFYGLNVTHSVVQNNTGNGVYAHQVRDRTALWNVTIESNEGLAGVLIRDGAGDVWVNDTSVSYNWGDGMNVSYVGGSININGSRFLDNRWRGFAFHHNASLPFLTLRHEIIIKGRPANNLFYPPTIFRGNFWGGVTVGNYCLSEEDAFEPKVLINYIQFVNNLNHPAVDVFACQREQGRSLLLDVTGNVFESNSEVAVRVQPAVNVDAVINSNHFLHNNYSALLIKNSGHPELRRLPARVVIAKNSFKFNSGPFIVSIGLNEDAPRQSLVFNQQNELRENRVYNPFPFLKPRSTPYAALVVSSSNVEIRHNCFRNPNSEYEIGTELMEHSKIIDAKENNWGFPRPENFMNRIFDQFNRYSLAKINIDPYSAVCNQKDIRKTMVQEYYRRFFTDSQPYVIGGKIYENYDLTAHKYTVVDDLQIEPGAKLTVAAGTVLEFMDGVGMLVQGELLRADYTDSGAPVIFTNKKTELPRLDKVRLVDEDGNEEVTAGRLEVFVDNQWGTVCNRSWTASLAQLACNQLGLTMDPQYFENWRIFVDKGDLPMVADNIRCEEREFDITQCRLDGVFHNVAAGCRSTEVVGLRCATPYWAGVRYSLLANPPTVTGQLTMHNWLIEKAGLYDFRESVFSPALQIDWNYHSFNNLTIRNNYFDGIDIVYNDLTKKPALRNTVIHNNRRNGLRLRSVGITVEDVLIENNENAGVRFNPRVSHALQKDIAGWLDRTEQPELEANNVFIVPNQSIARLVVFESQLNQRKFIVAKATEDCPLAPHEPCLYTLDLFAEGHEFGLSPKIAVQIVHRPNNESDEDAVFIDQQAGRQWSVRKNTIQFPLVSAGEKLVMKYTRSFGAPKMILLILFLDAQEYLDRFVHVYHSTIRNNQYGVSAVHYSNLTFEDGTVLNRHTNEKLWFQKVNFTGNSDAVVWIHSPQHAVLEGTPIAEITWHLDNCSVHHNNGPVIDTHRDLFASANVFHWIFWSNTFANNTNSGVNVQLPDTYDLRSRKEHSFWMTENRFERNTDFNVQLGGYYCFANISSNNFTDNYASRAGGILTLSGMEKELVMERNRFYSNWGHWMARLDIGSHSLKHDGFEVPSLVQYNYFMNNHFIPPTGEYVYTYPRSYTIGVFGSQKSEVHFNRLSNPLIDFEVVTGVKPHVPGTDFMNITFNWWGANSDGAIPQRVFDMDDWNSFTVAKYSPYFTSKERFLDFWWSPHYAQKYYSYAEYLEPSEHDLQGRMFVSKRLKLDEEEWYNFPHYLRPFRPYRITKDLTIMPGATLTIDKNVEVHIMPNVRILVLGDLVADATLWQPIRFLPFNQTEALQERGTVPTRYKRSAAFKPLERILKRTRNRISDQDYKHAQFVRKKRRAGFDAVYQQFPTIRRADPYFQRFTSHLTDNSTLEERGRAGFLFLYNATTGEVVPSCDRQFTRRNAQVVCRELGFETQNVYHWLTPRWDYNPRVRLVKTYMEPRECKGTEPSLDKCNLRLTGADALWMCMDNEHFNYVHCGSNSSLGPKYVGNWGGITFGVASLELEQFGGNGKDSSILRHVEVVGGGQVHNDSFQSAAMQVIRRNPLMENVNVTNSSMHGLQIISPRDSIVLTRLNISDNKGQGLSVLTTNLKASSANSPTPQGPINVPYGAVGLLDICAAGKRVKIKDKIIMYYKYDSFPVDCVKIFESTGRKLGFRFLQANFYGVNNGLGRSDALSIFRDSSFASASLLYRFTSDSNFVNVVHPLEGSTIAVHLRGTAADADYGFIAEVSAMPSTPDAMNVDEVALRNSRFINNDRGALEYRNTGEIGPNVMVEQCSVVNNGYFLYGNISTSSQAIEMHLHNTLLLLLRANDVSNNRGGLLVSAASSAAVAQLNAVIKNNAFTLNSNSTTLAFLGNNYQRVNLMNNVICLNFALYFDTCVVQGMSANFTHNLFTNNTGLNTVDTQGYSRISPDAQVFENNFFENNLALGHELQYEEAFGYQPDNVFNEFELRPRKKRSLLAFHDTGPTVRVKRQVLFQRGVSFDWWTHVGAETRRYRSTILAGSSQQRFYRNVFNNPLNSFELTTSQQTQYDVGSVDARDNYWGYPGTIGVAAGKIRDQQDFPYLIKVDYIPVLDSNTSLIEGDCPAGWFQAGVEEFKSCYLFVGASMTYEAAVNFCEHLNSFMPILRGDDPRQKEIARRIDEFGQRFVADAEKYTSYGMSFDTPIWVSSVTLPSNQCGYMSSRSGSLGEQNCNNLMPFICEKGTKPYSEPVLWRRDIIIFVVVACVVLLILALLLIGWCAKSKRRDEDFFIKKEYIRESLHRKKNKPFMTPPAAGTGNGFLNNAGGQPDKVIRAHGPLPGAFVAEKKKKPSSKRSSSTGTTSCSSSDRTYSTPSSGTRTCTDSLCTDNYSEATYTATVTSTTSSSKSPRLQPQIPKRSLVSNTPNPYAEIQTLRPVPPKPVLGPRNDTDLSTNSSCTTCSGVYSLRTCSCSHASSETTTTERESTITEESTGYDSSSNSTRSSDTTLTERPLLGRQVVSGMDRDHTRSSMATLRVSSRPDLSTNRSAADFFKGSGRPMLTPSRSNPSIYQPPVPAPRLPDTMDIPVVEDYDREPGSRVRRPSWHANNQGARSPHFVHGHIPVYNPNPDLKMAFSHSPTSGLSQSSLHSGAVTPRRPLNSPPQLFNRSLMDLDRQAADASANSRSRSKRNRPPGAMETSM